MRGDGAHAPVLGEEEAADLDDLRGGDHRALRRSRARPDPGPPPEAARGVGLAPAEEGAAPCQRSPYTEPPGSGILSHPGSPILSHLGSPDTEPPPTGGGRVPCISQPDRGLLSGNPNPEVTDGWTEVRGDRCTRSAPLAPSRGAGTPDRPRTRAEPEHGGRLPPLGAAARAPHRRAARRRRAGHAAPPAGARPAPSRTVRRGPVPRPSRGVAPAGRGGPSDLPTPRRAARLHRELLRGEALPAALGAAHAAGHGSGGGGGGRRGPGRFRPGRPHARSRQRPPPPGVGVRDDLVLQPPSVRRVRLRPDGGHLVPLPPGRLRVVPRGGAPGGARQPEGRDRPRGPLRPRGPTRLPGVRRALRLPHRALPGADARAQGEGRTGRRPLRQPELPGRPRLPRRPRRQRACPALVSGDGGPAGPRHDQAAAPPPLRDRGTGRALAAPAHALGAGDLEAGEAPPRLPRGLQRRLLLGPLPLGRPAALGAGDGDAGPAVPCARPGREPSQCAPRPAPDPPRAPPARQGPLPAPEPGVVPAAGGRDRAHLRRLHRGAPGRPPPRSPPERPGHPAAGPPLRGPPPRGGVCAGRRGRRVPLPHREDHPGGGPGSAAALGSTLGPVPRPTPPPRHARPWTAFFPDPGGEGGPPWN